VPERACSIVAEYRKGQPRIVTGESRGLMVERGGMGAGTGIRFPSNPMACIAPPMVRETELFEGLR